MSRSAIRKGTRRRRGIGSALCGSMLVLVSLLGWRGCRVDGEGRDPALRPPVTVGSDDLVPRAEEARRGSPPGVSAAPAPESDPRPSPIASAAGETTPSIGEASVQGRLVDAEGRGLAGAAVALGLRSTVAEGRLESLDLDGQMTTGEDGRFRFTKLLPGARSLQALCPADGRILGLDRAFSLDTGEDLDLGDLCIDGSGRLDLDIRVEDPSGRPVPQAKLRFAPYSPGLLNRGVIADRDGRVRLSIWPRGTELTLEIEARGFARTRARIVRDERRSEFPPTLAASGGLLPTGEQIAFQDPTGSFTGVFVLRTSSTALVTVRFEIRGPTSSLGTRHLVEWTEATAAEPRSHRSVWLDSERSLRLAPGTYDYDLVSVGPEEEGPVAGHGPASFASGRVVVTGPADQVVEVLNSPGLRVSGVIADGVEDLSGAVVGFRSGTPLMDVPPRHVSGVDPAGRFTIDVATGRAGQIRLWRRGEESLPSRLVGEIRGDEGAPGTQLDLGVIRRP